MNAYLGCATVRSTRQHSSQAQRSPCLFVTAGAGSVFGSLILRLAGLARLLHHACWPQPQLPQLFPHSASSLFALPVVWCSFRLCTIPLLEKHPLFSTCIGLCVWRFAQDSCCCLRWAGLLAILQSQDLSLLFPCSVVMVVMVMSLGTLPLRYLLY